MSASEGSSGSASAPPSPILTRSSVDRTPQHSPTKSLTAGLNHPALTTPLVEQMRLKWERPMNALPIHTDFQRMFPGISVEDEGELLWSKYRDTNPAERGSKEAGMREVFCLLAERDEEDTLLAAWVRRKFFEYIPDGASAQGAQTPIHFQRLLRDVIPESSTMAGVLKCINQAIAAPAVMILKLRSMLNKLNYKDCRGLWDCKVAFYSEKVVVTHVKWEESMPRGYEFAWAVDLELSRDCRKMTGAKLRIDTIKALEPSAREECEKLQEVFAAYITPRTVVLGL